MQKLCKDLYIPFNQDFVTKSLGPILVIEDRGRVIIAITKKNPAAVSYLKRNKIKENNHDDA